MNGNSINFAPEIRAHARSRRLDLTHKEVDEISRNLNSITAVENGRVAFTGGHFLDLGEAVAAMATGYGRPATAETSTPSTPATVNPWKAGPGFNRTQQAVLTNKDPATAARLRNEAQAR